MVNAGHDLDFSCGRSGQIAGAAGRDCCCHRTRADFVGPDEFADWAASGRHYLSREEHDFLFSAGDFDRGECGAFDFVVRDRADSEIASVLSSRISVLS